MNNNKGAELSLESYRIFKGETDNTPIELLGRCWKVIAVYLSDICLAVQLEPLNSRISKVVDGVNGAKDELYAVLQGIKQTAFEHDFMRPVVGVLSEDDFGEPSLSAGEVKRWIGDQDWHRGAFTLFVESTRDKATLRLFDLLAPAIPEIKPDVVEQRTPEVMEKKFRDLYKSKIFSQQSDLKANAKRLLDILQMAINPTRSKTQNIDADTIQKDLDSWKIEVMGEAEQIRNGRSNE
jgi:hypothetical protein